ncbi:MAG TPA: hypothetical protein VJQ09_09110 [Candidatus Limnocylindria bacterium]|nr:hypothetical protein [Candidatus Limnocylindria bacterium]
MQGAARLTRIGLIGAGLAVAAAASFLAGALGHDQIAAFLPGSLALGDTPPAWMSEYANAFCDADPAAVASRLDARVGTEDDVKAAFARRDWKCDTVRYLGSSNGRQGTAYIYVLHDPATGLYNWWVFTTTGQRIVRID